MLPTYFPYFLFPKHWGRTLLPCFIYSLHQPPEKTLGLYENCGLCWGRTQLSWLVTDLGKKVCQICYSQLTFQKLSLYIATYHQSLSFCFFFFSCLFLFAVTIFFLFHGRWPLKWPLLLLLLNCHACFLLCYLMHLPASYLFRRYVPLVWHSSISSVACFPAPARSFFQEPSCSHVSRQMQLLAKDSWFEVGLFL